jgi:hypothetical protein
VTAVSECDVAVILPKGNDSNWSYQIRFCRRIWIFLPFVRKLIARFRGFPKQLVVLRWFGKSLYPSGLYRAAQDMARIEKFPHEWSDTLWIDSEIS